MWLFTFYYFYILRSVIRVTLRSCGLGMWLEMVKVRSILISKPSAAATGTLATCYLCLPYVQSWDVEWVVGSVSGMLRGLHHGLQRVRSER